MPDKCRARALILFEIGAKCEVEEHKMQAVAMAQMWLTLAAIEDAFAVLVQEAEGTERP